MNRYVAVLLSIIIPFSGAVLGQSATEVVWLIRPEVANSSAVEVLAKTDEPGRYIWRLISSRKEVLAEMSQPALPKGFSVNFGNCRVDGILRHDILAFVKHNRSREWSGEVRKVWFANDQTNAFVRGATRNVECLNEGYGV